MLHVSQLKKRAGRAVYPDLALIGLEDRPNKEEATWEGMSCQQLRGGGVGDLGSGCPGFDSNGRDESQAIGLICLA